MCYYLCWWHHHFEVVLRKTKSAPQLEYPLVQSISLACVWRIFRLFWHMLILTKRNDVIVHIANGADNESAKNIQFFTHFQKMQRTKIDAWQNLDFKCRILIVSLRIQIAHFFRYSRWKFDSAANKVERKFSTTTTKLNAFQLHSNVDYAAYTNQFCIIWNRLWINSSWNRLHA